MIIAVAVSWTAGCGAVAGDAAPTTHQVADLDELTHPGSILAARWHVLLNDRAAGAIERLGTLVKTDSRFYRGLLFGASPLRSAVAHVNMEGGVLASPVLVDFGNPLPLQNRIQFYCSYMVLSNPTSPTPVELRINQPSHPVCDEFDPPGKDSIHIVLNHPDLNFKLTESGKPGAATGKQSILFDGQMKPGEAVGFLATYTGPSGTRYHHLIVWEIFRAEAWETWAFPEANSGFSCDWWLRNGPGKVRRLADTAVVWAARAKHAFDDPPAADVITLENRATVKLLGFSRPDRYGFCGWDPAGNPIAAPVRISADDSIRGVSNFCYVMETQESPTERPWPVRPFGFGARMDSAPRTFVAAVPASGPISTVMGVGPWTQIGSIGTSTPLKAANLTYTITGSRSFGPGFWVTYQRSAAEHDFMALTAVRRDGKEVASDEGAMVGVSVSFKVHSARFFGISTDDVKAYHLWLRKGHVVSFANFALVPNQEPPQSVTRDELLAASKDFQPPRAFFLIGNLR